jgi:parvulin-like peptidyl-prolyl isomerase
MKKTLWLVGSMLVFSLASQAQTKPAKIVDRIVAQVNDDIITLSDINREIAEERQQLAARYTGDQLEQELKKVQKNALEYLIQQKLFLQKANELGVGSGLDLDVSAFIEQKRKEVGAKDMDEFEHMLEQSGLSLSGYREDIKKQMIIQQLLGYFVDSRITLLSEELERYYQEHQKDFSSPEEVTLSEILIPSAGTDGNPESLCNEYRNRLLKGESFAALASQYSKGPTASRGGSIGTFAVSKLNPETARAIASVKEGDVSSVVKIPEGYAIYRVDQRKVSVVRPFDEVKNEIKQILYERKRQPEYDRFVAQLKEDAYIQIFSELGIGK